MWVEILLFICLAIMLIWWRLTRNHNYWAERGVITPPIRLPFGNAPFLCWDTFKKNMGDIVKDQYEKCGRPKMYGTYFFSKPILMICDPELAQRIMIKDFHYFVDRQSKETFDLTGSTSLADKCWTQQLTTLCGEEWKNVRMTFSPIFTSGKMKGMLKLIHLTSSKLADTFQSGEVNLKEQCGKFSMDTIASCAFGVNPESLSDKGGEVVANAKAIFKRGVEDLAKLVMAMTPGGMKLLNFLRIPMTKGKETMFFYNLLQSTMEQRRSGKVAKRNDLVDMMLEAIADDGESANEQKPEEENEDEEFLNRVEKESQLDKQSIVRQKQIDELSVVGTAMVMFVAGYDTTASTLSFACWELALQPEVQERLREEVDAILEENNGELPDYNQIQGMKYLDMVIMETLRKWPIANLITRACSEDYTIPGTKIHIKKGDGVHFGIQAIHYNPEYYPNPDQFDPERFNKENKAKRHPCAFLGFGQGPRSCIGMRFALLEAKMALFSILSRYTLVKYDKTPEVLTMDPSAGLLAPKEDLWVKAVKR